MCKYSVEIQLPGSSEVGRITVDERKGKLWLERTSFVSVLGRPVSPELANEIQRTVKEKAWWRLYQIDHELNPWYCPDCGEMYPGELWHRYDAFDPDGWHDSVRGRCPKGHERQLED